ncbi:restriction endonuclease [Acinetobacter baumannii]|nr:restriction endonuclease [Acinetobacter baumannii]
MNNWKKLEKHVQEVYSFLLNMKDEGIVVGHDVQIIDKMGRSHQVDVFYQFEKAGVIHKVAIECKDHGRPIDNGLVAKFYGKLINAGDIRKVMISKYGFQKLAKEIAEDNDVILLTIDELPKLNELIAGRIKSVALPDDTTIGEPFWTIMELRNGSVSGSYYGIDNHLTNRKEFVLFYSRDHAQRFFREEELDSKNWCIRGMPQYVFRGFLLMLQLFERRGYGASIFLVLPEISERDRFYPVSISSEVLGEQYYLGEMPVLKKD